MSKVSGEAIGCLFNIQQFSVHDGPGIRTIIFLSGCPLRCVWCCNPESQIGVPQLAYNDKKCIGVDECDKCLAACPADAIAAGTLNRKISISRQVCTGCGECAVTCPSKALEMLGRYMTVKEVLGAVEEDSCFYTRSGGGLTLSGGEPLFQLDFSLEILRGAKRLSLDTAVETCGHGTWDGLKKMGELVDCMFYDIKSCDPSKHKEFTGMSNEVILDNFEHLAREYPRLPIVVRTPVIPGFNDSSEEVAAIAKFIGGYRNVSHELMPYHAFGASKYTFLGRQYELSGVQPPTSEQMRALKDATSLGCIS